MRLTPHYLELNLTADQESDQFKLIWMHSLLDGECEQIEWNGTALGYMSERHISPQDVLHVLRESEAVSSSYAGDCFVVSGLDLDERTLSVVVAPPSAKNRVRVVKVWVGDS